MTELPFKRTESALTKIAILLACNDESAFSKRFPDDAECFRRVLSSHRPDWNFESVPVFKGLFPESAESHDGYIITGSPASVHGKEPWIQNLMAFVREIHEHRAPLVGCCFGHQAIAQALEGEVSRNEFGWGLGIAETRFVEREPWMDPFTRTVQLYAAHSEQVSRLPSEARIVGYNNRCPYAAFAVGNHIMAIGYHPEMTPEFIRALVIHMSPHLEREVVENALLQLEGQAAGAQFAGWIANFLDSAISGRTSRRKAT